MLLFNYDRDIKAKYILKLFRSAPVLPNSELLWRTFSLNVSSQLLQRFAKLEKRDEFSEVAETNRRDLISCKVLQVSKIFL